MRPYDDAVPQALYASKFFDAGRLSEDSANGFYLLNAMNFEDH